MSAKLYHLNDIRRAKPINRKRLICSRCSELCGYIHVAGFVFALKETRAKLRGERLMRGSWISVCPRCEACLLMQEFAWGVPFYSVRDSAVISIADYDNMDAANLLEFGNLCFTTSALTGAMHVADQTSVRDEGKRVEPLDRHLLGPTGIPDDQSANAEWLRQLEKLSSKLPERSNIADIHAAVRVLIRQVPNAPN